MLFQLQPIWKKAPFLRLLLPFMAGIIMQWHLKFLPITSSFFFVAGFAGLLLFGLTKLKKQYKLYWINGLLLNVILLSFGALLCNHKNDSHYSGSIKWAYRDSSEIIVTLLEPLSEKTNSYKALASANFVYVDSLIPVKGKILIYFKKTDFVKNLSYGDQLVFKKELQPIKNAGNPGGFDYKQYCEFQKIYYQVYLANSDFKILNSKNKNWLRSLLFNTRIKVLSIIKKYIPGEQEAGLAEALLIGYKDDLDKALVQSYSNTGAVHIIAISGLHLGLIYWLIVLLLKPVEKGLRTKWIKPVIVIACLWIFSLLAGGSPSVLRSAVMFTCIAAGEFMQRKPSIYNTLAASAFLLLCYNPLWLWDVGFQLSYTAVLSIVIFMKPIYNWFYVSNKILDFFWKLMATTLAAQILTIPISLFHFHQFPNFFLISNMVAVPLSSLILIGELLLCGISFIPDIAYALGWILHWLIWFMNYFIKLMDDLPYAVTDMLQINIPQVIFIYASIAGIGFWLMQKNKRALLMGLAGLFFFFSLRSFSLYSAHNQKKIIVYNVPRHQAIDFIDGTRYVFIGDEALRNDDFLKNFHLKPSRTFHRINSCDSLPGLNNNDIFTYFQGKKLAVIDTSLAIKKPSKKIEVDIIVLSKNPRVYISELLRSFDCKKIIFDSSNPPWKINKWKTDCDKAGIDCYSVADKGAFVMNVN